MVHGKIPLGEILRLTDTILHPVGHVRHCLLVPSAAPECLHANAHRNQIGNQETETSMIRVRVHVRGVHGWVLPRAVHDTLDNLGHHVVLKLWDPVLLAEDPELAEAARTQLSGRTGRVVGVAGGESAGVGPVLEQSERHSAVLLQSQDDAVGHTEARLEVLGVEGEDVFLDLEIGRVSLGLEGDVRGEHTSKTTHSRPTNT